jgi:hypothetical protein
MQKKYDEFKELQSVVNGIKSNEHHIIQNKYDSYFEPMFTYIYKIQSSKSLSLGFGLFLIFFMSIFQSFLI